MNGTDIWKSGAELEPVIAAMTRALKLGRARRRGIAEPLMVGIHTGGVWVAERLHRELELTEPLGSLDISFYRDDFTRSGLHPRVSPCNLPVAIDDRDIILVDDVIQSGRTVRAALNLLFDYGRPALVLLAVLVERDGRELPIEPNVVGLRATLAPGEQIKLAGPAPLRIERGHAPARRAPPAADTPR